MAFRVIPYLSYFRTWLVSHQAKHLHDAINLGSISFLLNNIDKCGKLAKSGPFDLESDLFIIQSNLYLASWSISSIKRPYTRNEVRYRTIFWEKLLESVKQIPTFDPFLTFRTLKMTFIAIQSNPSFGSSSVPSLASCLNRENLFNRFWENCHQVTMWAILTFATCNNDL